MGSEKSRFIISTHNMNLKTVFYSLFLIVGFFAVQSKELSRYEVKRDSEIERSVEIDTKHLERILIRNGKAIGENRREMKLIADDMVTRAELNDLYRIIDEVVAKFEAKVEALEEEIKSFKNQNEPKNDKS